MRLIHGAVLAAVASLSFAMPALADGSANAISTAADEGVGDDRIVCRKHVETGSLVRKKKQCFTKAEWDRIAAAEQVGVKRLQDELSTRSTGN